MKNSVLLCTDGSKAFLAWELRGPGVDLRLSLRMSVAPLYLLMFEHTLMAIEDAQH